VADAVNGDDDASDLVTAEAFGDEPVEPDDLAGELAETNLEDGADAGAATDTIDITTDTDGELVNFSDWTDNVLFTDATEDPGLAADLAAIKASTNLDWYGLALDSNSQAEIEVAALFVETEKKIAVFTTSDTGCMDPDENEDVMSALKANAYARSGALMSKKELLSYSGPAWMAKQFAGAKPGEDTWKFKTLAAISVDEFSASQRSAILAKNGNLYNPVSNINITESGTSGAGEFLDIVRFLDWLKAEIQFRVYSALINNQKIPYSDNGINAIAAIVKSALKAGEDAGGIDPGTSTVTTPKAKDIGSSTRATRKLSGVKFGGKLAGAIHELEIDGSLVP
jgi:hypothetical protein